MRIAISAESLLAALTLCLTQLILLAAPHLAYAADPTADNPAPELKHAPTDDGEIRVHLSSDHPGTRLMLLSTPGRRRPDGTIVPPTSTSLDVCGPPCRLKLPVGTYTIQGTDLVPSNWFDLDASASRVRLSATTVTQNTHAKGKWLLISGTAALAILAPLLCESAIIALAAESPDGDHLATRVFLWSAALTAVAGVAAAIVGMTMYFPKTTVQIEPDPE